VADPTTGTETEVALNAAEVLAAQDNRTPSDAGHRIEPVGPSWIQIGTEGGFLPAPVVIPNQPITWITDPTRFDVGNVDQHSLLLAPAERADVIVDFSQYRGKTLILYNDAPAAFRPGSRPTTITLAPRTWTPSAPQAYCRATDRTPARSCRSKSLRPMPPTPLIYQRSRPPLLTTQTALACSSPASTPSLLGSRLQLGLWYYLFRGQLV